MFDLLLLLVKWSRRSLNWIQMPRILAFLLSLVAAGLAEQKQGLESQLPDCFQGLRPYEHHPWASLWLSAGSLLRDLTVTAPSSHKMTCELS